jgi:hypothetical protein
VRLTRKPRGLNLLAQCRRPVFCPDGGCRHEVPRLYCTQADYSRVRYELYDDFARQPEVANLTEHVTGLRENAS